MMLCMVFLKHHLILLTNHGKQHFIASSHLISSHLISSFIFSFILFLYIIIYFIIYFIMSYTIVSYYILSYNIISYLPYPTIILSVCTICFLLPQVGRRIRVLYPCRCLPSQCPCSRRFSVFDFSWFFYCPASCGRCTALWHLLFRFLEHSVRTAFLI